MLSASCCKDAKSMNTIDDQKASAEKSVKKKKKKKKKKNKGWRRQMAMTRGLTKQWVA